MRCAYSPGGAFPNIKAVLRGYRAKKTKVLWIPQPLYQVRELTFVFPAPSVLDDAFDLVYVIRRRLVSPMDPPFTSSPWRSAIRTQAHAAKSSKRPTEPYNVITCGPVPGEWGAASGDVGDGAGGEGACQPPNYRPLTTADPFSRLLFRLRDLSSPLK